MKKILLPLVALAALLTVGCKDKENEPKKAESQNVVVSFDLGESGLRAAMNAPQDKIANDAPASVANIDVYLITGSGEIKHSKRFAKGTAEYDKLTSTTAIGQADNTGGYKFKDVDATVTKVFAVVNPQENAVQSSGNVSSINYTTKANANEVVYANSADVVSVGNEPYGVDPETGATNKVVKKAELTINGNMNRFQVATKFSRIVFADGTGEAIKNWKKTWLEDPANTGKSASDADAAFKQYIGTGFNNGQPTTQWEEFYKVEDITAKNYGVFMNRFDLKYNPFTEVADTRVYATTYAGTYTKTDGAWTVGGNDLSAFASYYNAAGFTTTFSGAAAKVLAFNFYNKNVTNYGENNDPKKGDAPKLHFYFGDDVPADNAFVNIVGYVSEASAKLDASDMAKGARLIDLDMNNINNGKGIIVTSVDPETPGSGTPDISKDVYNLIVRVTVAKWVAVNVKPVVE